MMAATGTNTNPKALLSHYSRIDAHAAGQVLFSDDNPIEQGQFAAALRDDGSRSARRRALNVTLPFCPVRCLDCNHDTWITHDSRRIDRYLDRLELEADLLIEALGHRPPLQELHLAGGSPNYLNEHQLVRLMSMLEDHFVIDNETEMSLNANPKQTSARQLRLLHGLGFRRIFFSTRDLDPHVQIAIGRSASIDMIRDVFETARGEGFETIGTDIVYGLPCQTGDGVKKTVDSLMTLSPDRITCFPFSRHAGARVHQSALAHCLMPSLADKMALFNGIIDTLCPDYNWIGVDSFAKHEDELSHAQAEGHLRRSWVGYSHLPSTSTHGLGTSAITDLDGLCAQNHTDIERWQTSLDSDGFPVRGGFSLSPNQQLHRDAIRSMVCNQTLTDYEALFSDGDEASRALWNSYARDGVVAIHDGGMRITEQGRYVLPHLLAS